MTLSTWLAFFVASWIISLSPGAGAISCMAAGLRHGYARAMWNILGLQIGIVFMLVVVAVGLGAILAASSLAFAVVKWLGVAYLVWLGIQQWRAPAFAVDAEAEAARKALDGAPHAVWLVLDATTGQNALQQARAFKDAVNVTGVILAKLDSSARGGMTFAIQRQLGLPILFAGLGEKPEDLTPFDPDAFISGLLTSSTSVS